MLKWATDDKRVVFLRQCNVDGHQKPFQIQHECVNLTFIVQDFSSLICDGSLRKHAYSNILKFLPPKNENLQNRTEQNRTLLLTLRSILTYEDMNKYTTLRHGGIYIYM